MNYGSLILTLTLGGILTMGSGCGKPVEQESAPQVSAKSKDTQAELPAVADPAPEMPESDDAVLVTVEGKSLTQGMASSMVQDMAMRQGVPPQMLQQYVSQMGQQMQQQVIDQFINQTLVEKEAARLDFPVTDEDIDKIIGDITKTLPEDMTLEQALASQNMNADELREKILKGERIRMLFESKTDNVELATDEQVQAFYTENEERFKTEESATASHILISCDETADEDTHAKCLAEAEAIRVQLEEGGDFAALALEKSSCPSKDKGGDLGSFGRGQMVPEFEEAAYSQELNKIGPVVKTKFGYHVILVTDRTEGGVSPLDKVSADIRSFLDNQARDKAFTPFLQSLRESAQIEYSTSSAL
ncbi:MAG: peptidylprolyl isomerase [Verrucomicrobia bacterium]|nr:peptidylprolyl isomerase [Verrucomicrobiota bacterium]